jgi:hypothetical protein
MTNRFLFALIVLFSFAEATFPAGALPVLCVPKTLSELMT